MVTIEKLTGIDTTLYSIEFELTLTADEYQKLMEIKKNVRLVCDEPLSLETILNICTSDGIYDKHKRYKSEFHKLVLGGIDDESECR